ncbi:glycerol-3-phosphate dehydrogenase/oxidase [Chelativorans intermedius]|uniref:Glycerol-3-phosphate dehydrogenase/oxidase n=1 Tax=Chelativorans intermedius TaxID=515947 RepID=A0ABV6DCM8_9HYPH|nr:glycerol-3-phosphate dehydrogenase/oxidase [Chelativorans intermedius]MCT9000435.1 glycerol-3-phosphate dehydrogenase/oxidase [Chelativorans intermedius]
MTRGTDKAFDVVILGGGVNGAGLFRDLCEQGVDCLLIDKNDFGSGTSAAPSRLIHGGLKYLETGEFGLVAQSTLERNLLLRNAPHLVRPLPTVIPIFSWTKGIGAALRTFFGAKSAPRSRGVVLVKIGLALYDFYGSRNKVMPRHSLWRRQAALKNLPALTPRIVAAGKYYDAKVTAPERLVWELIRDGLAANPESEARNATSLRGQRDGILAFEATDGTAFTVRAALVVNAAGPWIDRVNRLLGIPGKLIGGTKGSHIVLDHAELARQLDGRMIYFEADDGRICLVYEYLGRVLVGSTDIPADDPDDVRCEDDEVDYFLDSLRGLLPGLEFDRAQIVYAYSGIRPLPASDSTAPGLISRDHSAPVAEPEAGRPFPVISLVGGKWTTFRGFAEEVADTVLERLGRTRRVSTRELPIGGGRDYPLDEPARRRWITDLAGETGLPEERVRTLLERYGTTAAAILREEAALPESRFLDDVPDISHAEIAWIARNEAVVHLGDIVFRRTTLAVTGRLTACDLDAIARIAGAVLGWSEERRQAELDETLDTLRRRNLAPL